MSLALRFRNAGRSFDEYVDAMSDPGNGASIWYRAIRDGRAADGGKDRKSRGGRARALTELQRCWHKAGERSVPRHRDVSDVAEIAEQVLAAGEGLLVGRGSATRRKVLTAICMLAIHYADPTPILPVRTVALEAGVSAMTAARALRALADVGLLRRVKRSNGGAIVYALARKMSLPDTDSHAVRRGRSVSPRDIDFDAWRHGAFGSTGLLIWQALGDDEQSVAEVAATAGVGRSTAYRRLAQLRMAGLAVEVEAGRWVRGAALPDVEDFDPYGCHSSRREHDADVYADQRARHRRAALTVLRGQPPPPPKQAAPRNGARPGQVAS